ncbi:HesB/IscA family protein [Paraherbaspirillum soli]|uniref:HesB/IscA family protein n=1 Tax=Paraherbaspirillum soli TaxID=631222 RepID=A0ABW0MBR7_9BURK
MAIRLTTSAAQHVRNSLAENSKAIGLRLGVRKVGCSGLGYTIAFADAIGSTDRVFVSHGIKVLVDAVSLAAIDGTEVDFAKDGFNETFVFRNPNVKDECGCGESFSV